MAHLEAFFRGSKNSRTYLYAKIFLTLKIPLSEPFFNLFANLAWRFSRAILYGLGKFMYFYFLGI